MNAEKLYRIELTYPDKPELDGRVYVGLKYSHYDYDDEGVYYEANYHFAFEFEEGELESQKLKDFLEKNKDKFNYKILPIEDKDWKHKLNQQFIVSTEE